MGGFPGPYTHWPYVDERMSEDGLLKLLEGIENRNACLLEAFLLIVNMEESPDSI